MGASELRHLVSAVYVGLCEQLGPVAADATLDREIEIIQSRIDSLDEKIRKAEGSVQ